MRDRSIGVLMVGGLPRTTYLAPNGGRVRRAVYGKTRKEAADKLADLIAKTSAGIPLATESWTVAGYAAHWLEDVARPRLKPATFMSYRRRCGCTSCRRSGG